jgi:hypothetical protein
MEHAEGSLNFKEWLKFLAPRLPESKFGRKFKETYKKLLSKASITGDLEMDYETFQLWEPIARAIKEKVKRAEAILQQPYPEKRTFGDTFRKMKAYAVVKYESGWVFEIVVPYIARIRQLLYDRYPTLGKFLNVTKIDSVLIGVINDPDIETFYETMTKRAATVPSKDFYNEFFDGWLPSLILICLNAFSFVELLENLGFPNFVASYIGSRIYNDAEYSHALMSTIHNVLISKVGEDVSEALTGKFKEILPNTVVDPAITAAFAGRCTAFQKAGGGDFSWVYCGYYQYLLETGKISIDRFSQDQAWELMKQYPFYQDVSDKYQPPDRRYVEFR